MTGWTIGVIVLVVLIAAGIGIGMVIRPRQSGGAPGEVAGDRPLSEATGASMEDRAHAGPAEDRPGDPGQEPMDPDAFTAPSTEQDGEERGA